MHVLLTQQGFLSANNSFTFDANRALTFEDYTKYPKLNCEYQAMRDEEASELSKAFKIAKEIQKHLSESLQLKAHKYGYQRFLYFHFDDSTDKDENYISLEIYFEKRQMRFKLRTSCISGSAGTFAADRNPKTIANAINKLITLHKEAHAIKLRQKQEELEQLNKTLAIRKQIYAAMKMNYKENSYTYQVDPALIHEYVKVPGAINSVTVKAQIGLAYTSHLGDGRTFTNIDRINFDDLDGIPLNKALRILEILTE